MFAATHQDRIGTSYLPRILPGSDEGAHSSFCGCDIGSTTCPNGTGHHLSIDISLPYSILGEPLHTSPTLATSKIVVQSSGEDDLGNDQTLHDTANIQDDEQGGRADKDEDTNMDDMDNFIEYDCKEMDGTGAMNGTDKNERRGERWWMEKKQRKALGNCPELLGINAK